jgi:hypothetical protein
VPGETWRKYLSAFPTTWFDRLEKRERVWAPFYTIHKIMAGMFDMYRLAGNQEGVTEAHTAGPNLRAGNPNPSPTAGANLIPPVPPKSRYHLIERPRYRD